MSTEDVTARRVEDALKALRRGLTPFVEARMKGKHGDDWRKLASRASGGDQSGPLDTYGLLKTIVDNWRYTFDEAFGPRDRFKVRNFVSTALDARNATAHLTLALQDAEALRYLDAIYALLLAVKAPDAGIAQAKGFYEEQRRSGLPPAPAAAEPGAIAAPPRETLSLKLDAAAPSSQGAGAERALRPWREVALPHPDVLENRFKEAEFAADLFAVDAGHASDDYKRPEDFFRITFLTEGLRRILSTSLQRMSCAGGDPVIGLQTAFGGGKTHTMLAVYHLAKARDLSILEGVGLLAQTAGIKDWTPPKVAVFVGTLTIPHFSGHELRPTRPRRVVPCWSAWCSRLLSGGVGGCRSPR